MHALRTMLLFTALVGTTQQAIAQSVPPASDVIANYVKVIGGKEAIMKISSVKQVGTMEIPAMGLNAEMENFAAAPNKMSSRMSIPSLGDVVTGTDGIVAWSNNPMQGPRLIEDKELAETKAGADFYASLLFPADRYASMENLGVVDFNGEKSYKLKLVRKDTGKEAMQYFSVSSGLVVGAEMTQSSPMGDTPMTMMVSDYKAFGGVKFPTRTEMMIGANKIISTVSDIIVNGAPDSAFDVPEAIKPLIKK